MTDARADAVARALRRLSRPELAAFVRDCYRARGWDTRVDGDVVVATSGGSTRVVLPVATRRLPGGGRRPPDRTVDVVFAAAETDRVRRLAAALDARTVAGRSAAEMVLYGVAADERAALCRRHLGATPGALRPPVTMRVRRGVARAVAALRAATVEPPAIDGTRRAVLALVVVGLVPLALVVGGWTPGVAPVADAEPDPTTSESTASSVDATPVGASDASAGTGLHHRQPNASAATGGCSGSDACTGESTLHHLRAHVIPTSTDGCTGSGTCANATAAASDDERDGPTLQELWPTGARATSANCLDDAACATSAIVAADERALDESTMHHLRSHVQTSDEQ